uniref:Uncharacterized protein n=1 Tax=Strigamia maritima TaxID=126957 RepID=T1IS57_STRMM
MPFNCVKRKWTIFNVQMQVQRKLVCKEFHCRILNLRFKFHVNSVHDPEDLAQFAVPPICRIVIDLQDL